MRTKMNRRAWLAMCGAPAMAQAPLPDNAQVGTNERNLRYRDELEHSFRTFLVDRYPERAGRAWQRSYASAEALIQSVEPNRRRYRRMLAPPDWKPAGALERKPHPAVPGLRAEWLSLPLGPVKA